MIKRAEDMVKLYNEHMRGGDGTVETTAESSAGSNQQFSDRG